MRGGKGVCAMLSSIMLGSSGMLLLEMNSGDGLTLFSDVVGSTSSSRLLTGGVAIILVVIVVGGGSLALQNRRLFLLIIFVTCSLRLAFGDIACVA